MNWYSELLSTCRQDLLPLDRKILSRPICSNYRVWTSCFNHNVHFVEYHWPLNLLSLHKIQFWNVPLAQDNSCVHSSTWYGEAQYCCQFQMFWHIEPGDCKGFLHHYWRLFLAGWHKKKSFPHENSRPHHNFQPYMAWGGNPMVFQLRSSVSLLRL